MKRFTPADALLCFSLVCLVAAGAYRSFARSPSSVAAPPPILREGEHIPSFWADLGWSGAPAGPSLVIFYTSECPFCRISVGRWNRLEEVAQRVPGARVVAVGLSDSTASLSYPHETGLRYPIHLPVDVEAMEARWKVPAVPYTVVVGPEGDVRGAWRGVLDDLRYEQVAGSLRAGRP